MAVGTVSTVEQDNWQLIGTSTPSGTAAATFTSIAGYKRLMLVWKKLTCSSNNWLFAKVNNDNTAGNYSSHVGYPGSNDYWSQTELVLSGSTFTNFSGMMIIENANQSIPHEISRFSINFGYSYADPAILASDPITRLDIYMGANFTGGTVYLYGIPA